ncbi:hypothetical protein Ssi03_77380 [Sphaerisporangium siamense]|uniref:Uncharacterized protein n=1 Tax=Sphaerisporangium siamense TaxID=795645 RepID=A0A7W7DHK3_9ACTN|nr:hypothetical protein [Sphaerisporangium siamense]MBB4706160.1 hypothetical protein [Sphaerisporangium siamense]GII89748.1 hypothetical protein Ssi03_77380 [Sphaerisporangium siamense]
MTAARTPRARPGATSSMRLTPQVEQISTGTAEPPSERASTPARQHAEPSGDDWVNFSTYLPRDLRRRLKAHCAGEEIELREAVAMAVQEWLDRQ